LFLPDGVGSAVAAFTEAVFFLVFTPDDFDERLGGFFPGVDAPELRHQVAGILGAVFRFFVEESQDEAVHFIGDVGIDFLRRDGGGFEVSSEEILGIRSLKRRFSGHDFIDGDPEAVIVGGGGEDFAEDLVGRHIGPRSLNEVLASIEELAETSHHFLSQGEIAEAKIGGAIEEKVVWFDVAVDIFFRVNVTEGEAGEFDESFDSGLE